MSSKQEKLNGIYSQLQASSKCRNKKEFAAMLDVSYTGLTRAMNGDEQYLTNSLVAKAAGLIASPAPAIPDGSVDTLRVRLIPYEARGGTIGDFVDGVHDYDCEKVISPIKGVDFAMTVTGDSMMPEYNPGDRILIKRIDPNLFIEWGRVYVLDTPNGAVIKKLERSDGTLIEKDCSSNWARHTWATMCAELDVPDPTISLGMGHRIAGHRTTAIYIKRDQRKVDEANRKVIDYIKGTVPHLTTQDGE